METQEVADFLMQNGYAADALHGDLSQAQRYGNEEIQIEKH
jgi:ATP-dependent RNA helicase DeaD